MAATHAMAAEEERIMVSAYGNDHSGSRAQRQQHHAAAACRTDRMNLGEQAHADSAGRPVVFVVLGDGAQSSIERVVWIECLHTVFRSLAPA